MNEDLVEKLKDMPLEQLESYIRGSRIAERIVDIVAVIIILMAFIFTSAFTIIGAVVSTLLLGNLASAIIETRNYIQALIDKR